MTADPVAGAAREDSAAYRHASAAAAPMQRQAFARGRARFGDLLAAEWIKLWSLRSTPAALMAVVALSVYLAHADPRRVPFDGPVWLLPMLGAGALGAQSIVGEHSSGLIHPTLVAVPDRVRVVLAKAAVVAAVAAVLGLVVACSDLAVVPGAAVGSASVPPLAAGAVTTAVCALAGAALGALVRNLAATSFGVCVVLGFLPLFLRPDQNHWATDAANALPYYAWGRLAGAGHAAATTTAPVAWGTLAAWAGASILLALTALDRRDV
ncbi:MAG: hypothetical protein ACRDSS_12720 [Actinocrinis sp.]